MKFIVVLSLGLIVLVLLLASDGNAADCAVRKPSNIQQLQTLASVLKPKPVVIGALK